MEEFSTIHIPPSANILAFQRTKDYPKPGSIVSIDSKIIENYVKDIEQTRDADDRRDYGKIRSKLPAIDPASTTFFYSTHNEVKYQKSADILLIVNDVIPSKKGCRIKCHMQMLFWPYDVETDSQFIYIDDQDVSVVKPVICSPDWKFSDTSPDNEKTFGFQVNVNDVKIWHVFEKIEYMPRMYIGTSVELGFKEFSYISAIPTQTSAIEETSSTTVDTQPIATTNVRRFDDDELNEEDFDAHPMAEFVKRLYEIACGTMHAHGIATSPEFREILRQKYIKLTNNSDMSVEFYDEDDE